MIYLLLLLLALVFIGLVVWGITTLVASRQSGDAQLVKNLRGEILEKGEELEAARYRLLLAKRALTQLASDYAHNPQLNAQLALDEINMHELNRKEIA